MLELRDTDDGVREATVETAACSENLTLRLQDCAGEALRLLPNPPLRVVGRSLGCFLIPLDDLDAEEPEAESLNADSLSPIVACTFLQCSVNPSDE